VFGLIDEILLGVPLEALLAHETTLPDNEADDHNIVWLDVWPKKLSASEFE